MTVNKKVVVIVNAKPIKRKNLAYHKPMMKNLKINCLKTKS